MDIPLLDLKAQYKSIQKEIEKKVMEVISSQVFILGPEVEGLEREISVYTETKHAVGVSSGSDALLASLMALEVAEGDVVITTPFTFFATAGAISRLKARPVFCDIERKSFNLCPDKLASLLEDYFSKQELARVKAVIPIHLYGQCADMDPILSLGKEHGFLVIEDAAQAIGAEYPSKTGFKKACSMGKIGILSFFPSKNLGGFGDGGMILSDDANLAQKIMMMRMHGSKDKYYYEIIGGNFRLDAVQAAILRVKLKYLDIWQDKKREKALHYDKLFNESGLIEKGFIQPPEPVYKSSGVQNYHTYHQYVVRARERDKLKAFLKEKGIATAIYYPLPLHLQKCFSYLGYRKGDFPESEKAAEEVLALPIYPELSSGQQNFIVASIAQFYKG